MGEQGQDERMRVKAATFRAYVGILVKEGKRDAVRALVPPATAALIADPPLAGSWMDLWHLFHITEAMEKLGGMAAVRDLARKGTEDARRPYMGVVEGVLRLFGTSPATLFKRMNSLVGSFIEGVDYRFTSVTDRSGVMEVEYKPEREIPLSGYVGGIPSLQVLLDVCGVKGVIGPPERLGPYKGRYHIQW